VLFRSVDQSNVGNLAATGEIIVGIMDDLSAPPGWDDSICQFIPDTSLPIALGCNPRERKDLLNIPRIITRPLLERLGPVSPDYESMFMDNEDSAKMRSLGTVIEVPLYFEHKHPLTNGKAEIDEVYALQNREEAYAIGQQVFERRRAQGFPRVELPGWSKGVMPSAPTVNGAPVGSGGGILDRAARIVKKALAADTLPPEPPPSKVFVACLPGPDYDRLGNVLNMQGYVQSRGYNFQAITGYTSSPDATRYELSETALQHCGGNFQAPFIFWMDDDNIIKPEQLHRLVTFMENNPRADIVIGWCWIRKGDEWTASFGEFLEDDGEPYAKWWGLKEILACGSTPTRVDRLASGFPCVLMRREVLEKLGPQAFNRIPSSRAKHGYIGEDFSFFYRAWKAGMSCYLDPLCKVGHIKPTLQEPNLLIPPGASISPELRAWLQQVNGNAVEIPAMP
jgi:hypothetical protein